MDQNTSVIFAQRLRGVIRCCLCRGMPEASLVRFWHGASGNTTCGVLCMLPACPGWLFRRCDSTQELSADACKRGAAGRMLLERLLPELAFKMGRAPKYGA